MLSNKDVKDAEPIIEYVVGGLIVIGPFPVSYPEPGDLDGVDPPPRHDPS